LKVNHEGNQRLQRFYVTDLGFNQVLLGYPWLSTFNPRIDWKEGKIKGSVTLRTVKDAWERWKELRRQALVARTSLPEEEDIEFPEDEWGTIARTNFAQEWAQEAKQTQTSEV
jgi:hypothetical protein